MPHSWKQGWALASVWVLASLLPASPQVEHMDVKSNVPTSPLRETLHYSIEWRLFNAGGATVERVQAQEESQTSLHLESAGLVSKLYKVTDDYKARYNARACVVSSHLIANEGSRHRETEVIFDGASGKARYTERDLTKDAVADTHEIDIPDCTNDIIGALAKLRTLNLEPGRSGQIPVSDGKKSVLARVEAQRRENVKTDAGAVKTIRYEAYLFNNVLYRRPARLLVWISDDARRLPVQIQVRLQFPVGTITLHLDKEEL
jgi:Protein of unknown function (DUF3108)